MYGTRKQYLKTACCVLLCFALIMAGTVTGYAEDPDDQSGQDFDGQGGQPVNEEFLADGETPPEQPSGEEPPEEEIVPVATKISGVPARLVKNASDTVTLTVKVSPANGGRTVKLQQYDSDEKTWKTRKKYTTEDQDKVSLELTLAKKYRKKTTGKWRVVVSASDTALKVVSKVCTVITRNIKTVKLSAKSACVYCVDTGEFICTKKYKTKRIPASTTKLMTAVLFVESGKLGGKTKVSKKAANTPWSYGRLRKGDKYRNIDLLYAIMLPSSNSAASAAAESVSGSISKFVKKMNKKADELGLKNTHFCNPHGLHKKGHYSTAQDLAKLTAYAYDKEEIRKAMGTGTRTIKSLRYKRRWTLYSTDMLLGKIKNFFGGKTGTSPEGKYTFTGVYKYKKKTYVTVVLNAGTAAGRWSDTKKMQSYIRNYAETRY